MIVVFDTDVLIPMILPASRSARLFSRLRAAGHNVALSPQILVEVREKLLADEGVRDWLELPDEDLEAYLKDLPKLCLLTKGSVVIHGAVKDDPKDDKILAAAKESGATYLVSEDRHLRKLKEWEGIKILNRDECLAELDRLGVP